MSQNPIQETTLFASHHTHVEKRLHIAGVVFSSLLAIMGGVCFFCNDPIARNVFYPGNVFVSTGDSFFTDCCFPFFLEEQTAGVYAYRKYDLGPEYLFRSLLSGTADTGG